MFSAIPLIAFDGVKVCMSIFMYLHVIYVVKEVTCTCMSFWEFGQLMVVVSPQNILVSHVTT